MKIQSDTKYRVIALSNLKQMCKEISGVCHRYWIEKITKHTIYVGYSNPDEYATDNPCFAVFPCYKGSFNGIYIVLDIIRMINDPDDILWQAFDCLLTMSKLWRSPDGIWKSEEEIKKEGENENIKNQRLFY